LGGPVLLSLLLFRMRRGRILTAHAPRDQSLTARHSERIVGEEGECKILTPTSTSMAFEE
jgi:hypothetical protein